MPIYECGVCLEPVTASECPDATAMAQLPTCDGIHVVGGLCEGDGECGTSATLNNCNANGDVYKSVQPCDGVQPPWSPPHPPASPPLPPTPPSPPNPPMIPMPTCDAIDITCSAGPSTCGYCLVPVDSLSCPSEAIVATLPNCYWALPGDLCEGDGECGTRKTLNNCHLKDDVYRRIACIPSSQPAPPADAASGFGGGFALGAGVASVVALALFVYSRRAGGWDKPQSRARTSSSPRASTSTSAANGKTEVFVTNEHL